MWIIMNGWGSLNYRIIHIKEILLYKTVCSLGWRVSVIIYSKKFINMLEIYFKKTHCLYWSQIKVGIHMHIQTID